MAKILSQNKLLRTLLSPCPITPHSPSPETSRPPLLCGDLLGMSLCTVVNIKVFLENYENRENTMLSFCSLGWPHLSLCNSYFQKVHFILTLLLSKAVTEITAMAKTLPLRYLALSWSCRSKHTHAHTQTYRHTDTHTYMKCPISHLWNASFHGSQDLALGYTLHVGLQLSDSAT